MLDGVAGPRWRLLESARAYALEQLAAALLTAPSLQRHAQVTLAFLRRIDDANMDGELRTDEYAAQVLPELDNLRAAYAWATGKEGNRATAIGLAAHISPLIDYSLEFVDWVLVQRPHVVPGAVDDLTAARFWRSLAASNLGGFVAMGDQLEAAQRAAVLYRQLGLPKRLFRALRRKSAWATNCRTRRWRARPWTNASPCCSPIGDPSSGSKCCAAAPTWPTVRATWMRPSHCVKRPSVWRGTSSATGAWRSSMQPVSRSCSGAPVAMPKRPSCSLPSPGNAGSAVSDYELLDALETQLWILSDLGDLPAAKAVGPRGAAVMRRMPRFCAGRLRAPADAPGPPR